MKCPKCEGKGFIEYESGTIMVECAGCNGTGEVEDIPHKELLSPHDALEKLKHDAHELGIDFVEDNVEELPEGWEDKGECIGGFLDDTNSGSGQPDSDIGSADTSQPQLKSKPKSKKTSRKRAK